MPEAIVALGEQKIEVGRLHFESDGRRQHSTFIYSSGWLRNPQAFALAPGLPLGPGPIHASGQADTRDALPGAFADAAPDSWGRRLMARTLGEGLSEFEYLVRSDDVTRQGALRFLDERMEPLSQMTDSVPRRLDIEEIRAIAARYERDPLGAAEEARILAGAGGSLGGARPKANVIDGDQLWIAKFTAVGDTWPVERAEVAILNLGRALGMNTAVAELALPRSEGPVALIRRFDRRGEGRIPYISARTALRVQGVTPSYYTDIADVIREISVDALADLRELWRRMVFSILVNNTDDHLKNHGFLYVRDNRWRLAPAFDINAQARRQPQMETGISPLSGFEPSVEAAVEAAPFFEISQDEARQLARDLADGISTQWQGFFQSQGVRGAAATAYAAAFEHEQMEMALRLTP